MGYRVAVVHGADPKQIHAQNRAHGAADLYNQRKARIVVTTGRYEADELAQIVFKDGVPPSAIRTETKSRTTYQNLRALVSEIFPSLEDATHRFELVYLISQEWHRPRLLYVARHVLGNRYPYEFYPALDGRSEDEVNADANLERPKFLVDRASLLVPVFGGMINSAAYWAFSRVHR